MSMGDPSGGPRRPRWRDDPAIGRSVRSGAEPAATAARPAKAVAPAGGAFDIARDSDVPISTQLYWQLAYQIDTGRLLPGARLPTVRELGAILHVNPNTVRSVYKRLAEAGYVVSRQGAGTRVMARALQRRTSGTLEGLVAELLRTAARAGYSADEVASAVYSVAAERKRPGPRVEILFVECTTADAQRAAERIAESFEGLADADGVLIDLVNERLGRFHYDLVATSTFHADETIAIVDGRAPVIAMLAAPSYAELLDEVRALPRGSIVGLVCATERSTQNIAQWLRESGGDGVVLLTALQRDEAALQEADRTADLLLLTREALEIGMAARFGRQERIREWTYDLDPAGLELLRRAVDRIRAARGPDAVAGGGGGRR
jgi:DNA-binding transcriptional regulator YhcF (GntR family)/rhodanese-related sulfurtransferase